MENPDDIITIKTYNSEIEADFAKNILETYGIKAVVIGRDSLRMARGYDMGIELRVKRSDAQKALKLLELSEKTTKSKDKFYSSVGKGLFPKIIRIILFALLLGFICVIISGIIETSKYWIESGSKKTESPKAVIQKENECVNEGEIKCNVMGCKECCSGLTARYVKTPMKNNNNEVICVEEMTTTRCVKCGDGICGKGEDWCVCPEDCEKPNFEDLELYPF